MKLCSKCGENKPESNFYIRDKRTGRLHAQCKQCYSQQRAKSYRQHYQKYKATYRVNAQRRRQRLRDEFRKNMIAYADGKYCIDCGETDSVTFEFDHIDPATKSFNVSQAVRLGYSWEKVLEEIKKCQIVCANCHKRRSAKQFGWYKA